MARLALALVAVLLSACALTPDYERPELEVPDVYREPAQAGASLANVPWFDLFRDDALRELIERALEDNQDLGLALARIAEARGQLTITRAERFPFLDVLAGASRGKQSAVIVPGAATRDTFAVSADVFFEVDLWRRLQRATEAAHAELLATEASYRNVSLTLVADVASFYFLLRGLDERHRISVRTAEARRDALAIIEARFEKGTVPEIDVNQAEIELAVAEAAVASFERQIVQTENALRTLIGRAPGAIERGSSLREQELPFEIPTGLPSELLQRRPDVIDAEERLIAETARIGVAEALRYPSISLTGSFGAVSDELSDLDEDDAESWGIAANLFAPIFNSGQLRAQAEAQRARAEQARESYESTLLRAFREVEDSLVAVRTSRLEHDARQRQVTAARNAARLSRARYDGGIVDYLEVLDAERSLFSAELDESATLERSLTAVVRLYKALGGGWTPPSP